MTAGGDATGQFVAWLERAGLQDLAADMLEAAGPLAFLGAQLSYFAEPFLGGNMADLGRALENPDELARKLRGERS